MAMKGMVWHSSCSWSRDNRVWVSMMVARHKACLYNNVYILLYVSSSGDFLSAKVNDYKKQKQHKSIKQEYVSVTLRLSGQPMRLWEKTLKA